DGALRPAPLGVPGQLHVGGSGGGSEGGSGLARGYRGRPAATAACFVPDPTGLGGPGGRLYATGDLVRSGPDGRLRFLGRIDHQVKLRGHRIELGEIEQVLLEHPAVAEAAVVLREDRPGDQRLVAYVSGGEADPERLREHLLARLPAFMVPAAFVRLERLPRTPNRKLDRAALPAPALPEPAEEPSRRPPPESAAGRTLAEIWAEILGVEVDRLGAGDDFFGLGGHSLLVSRLLVRVRERLGVELALAEIFRNSTLEGLARQVEARQVEARQAEARQVELGGAAPAGRPATLPRCLMAIRTGGAAPPLFLVHPASGSPLCFVDLALRLGEERPVFGFQSPLLEGDRWRPRSLGEMAVRYVDEMRAVRPAGPYLLGGWSFGCAVAYEMARLLERDGQEVGLLFLLDAGPEVPAGRAGASGPRRTLGLFTETARLVAGTPLPRSYRDLRVLASWAGVSLPESPRAIWRRPWKARLRFLAELARQVVRSIDAFRSNLAPALRYRPRPYAGRAVLFRAREGRPPSGRDALADDVRRLAHGGAEIVEVPGNHMTLLDRHHAGGLAARVDELLAPGPDGALGPNRPQSNHDDPLQGDRR
ncbi:MAG: thioesterase domain-containing protein, partial [Acidobacteriota bacterium]